MGRSRVKKTKKERNLSRRIEKNVRGTNLPYKSQVSQPRQIREIGLGKLWNLSFNVLPSLVTSQLNRLNEKVIKREIKLEIKSPKRKLSSQTYRLLQFSDVTLLIYHLRVLSAAVKRRNLKAEAETEGSQQSQDSRTKSDHQLVSCSSLTEATE